MKRDAIFLEVLEFATGPAVKRKLGFINVSPPLRKARIGIARDGGKHIGVGGEQNDGHLAGRISDLVAPTSVVL